MSIHQQLSTIIGHDILIDIKRKLTLEKIAIKVKEGKVTKIGRAHVRTPVTS